MKHYFIADPSLPINERELTLTRDGFTFRFTTTTGLFSYEKPDDASVLLLDHLPPLRGSTLDLGCGYGLLGTVTGKRNPAPLTLSDTNEIACRYAARNAKANGVTARVVHSDGFAQIADCFDNILHNPPIHAGKDTMYRLYTESAAFLTPHGALYLVIQKKHGAESTIKFLTTLFARITTLHKRKGYYILRCAHERT